MDRLVGAEPSANPFHNHFATDCFIEASKSGCERIVQHFRELASKCLKEVEERQQIEQERSTKLLALEPWFDKLRKLDRNMQAGADTHVIE